MIICGFNIGLKFTFDFMFITFRRLPMRHFYIEDTVYTNCVSYNDVATELQCKYIIYL